MAFFSLLMTAQAYAGGISVCARVEADIKTFDRAIFSMKNDFGQNPVNIRDKQWVAKKLNHMFAMDQYLRETATNLASEKRYNEQETECFWHDLSPRWSDIDSANTADLKALMKIYNWFWISQFGLDINERAWNLAQHADQDRVFQKEVLALIKDAYPRGEALAKHYAFLYDRVVWYGDGQPQRYATQGQCKSPGNWQPQPTEDFGGVNRRRAQMGLNSFEENKARLDKVCH
ncbi:MAG: hypothetical protein EOP04_13800 [Proteobacteria bacterium]|nr:MAG: hypothetical protein EOP04_13800 [Pseudomonadota bacterium]